jgi:FkbM family methyltransferase
MGAEPFYRSGVFRELVAGEPLVLADVGARGELEEPWAHFWPETLRVLGFEPDREECARLERAHSRDGWSFFPVGLWDREGEVSIHVADRPSCSSVHPPNLEMIQGFEAKHWTPRLTRSVVSYPCTTLDAVLAGAATGCDFLKVDTQGSEYEILSGARGALTDQISGVLVETWTTEVHRGQRLTGDVLALMAGLGFDLFDVNVAAAWRRATASSDRLLGKSQVVGLDLLFLKHPARLPGAVGLPRVAKAAAIADAYGFPDFAVQILRDRQRERPAEAPDLTRASEQIIRAAHARQGTFQRIRRRLLRTLRRRGGDFASLHG